MPDNLIFFSDVSLLITHYNRSASLERLLKAFRDLDISFEEIVVSDDGSKPEHLDYIKTTLKNSYEFTLVTTDVNKGLGNNINKGQNVVTTPYTLYVQEDFVPLKALAPHLQDAINMMNEDSSIDMARFYAYVQYPYTKPYKNGFSEILYKPWYLNTLKLYNYSDHPHLRRANFFKRFGQYVEGQKGDKTEYAMCISFLQNKGKALFYDDYKGLFDQVNSSAEPSTVKRSEWKQHGNPFTSMVRWVFRTVKYNYAIHIDNSFKQ